MTVSDRDLFSAFSDLHVALENTLEFEAHTGILSDDGTKWDTDVPGRPGFWWVRRDSDGLQVACFNDAGSKPDQPVICRWDTKTGTPTIVRVHNEKTAVYNPVTPPVSVPPISTGPGSGREQYNPAFLISDGLVYAGDGMTVKINPFVAVYQQSQNYYVPSESDLTPYIPATAGMHCWALVGYDPVLNVNQVATSTPIPVSLPLLQAQISTISFDNYIPLGAVQLTNGQTTLQFPGQFADRRPWITGQWWTMPLGVTWGGTGLATLPANLLLAGNGTSPLQSVTNGTVGQPLLATSGLPAYGALNLAGGASIVTGTLPVTNGGTGAVTLTAHDLVVGNGTSAVNFLAPGTARNVTISDGTDWTSRALTIPDLPSGVVASPLMTKGDIWTYDTANQRLGVGANNTVLVADSTQSTGNKWSSTLAGLTLTAPTIGDFTNANHNHQNTAGGGTLDAAAIASGTLNNARVNWAAPGTIGSTTPNTGAFTNVTITGGGYIRPSVDSTAALLIQNAAQSQNIGVFDTTNWRYGLNITPSQTLDIGYGNFRFTQLSAPGAPTVALAGLGAGNLTNGIYSYQITLVNAAGETQNGTTSANVTVVDATTNGQIALSAIPTGVSGITTARKIYRTVSGGSVYKLVATISDNTTTTYTDNIADASLGANAPTNNTTAGKFFVGAINYATVAQTGEVGFGTAPSIGTQHRILSSITQTASGQIQTARIDTNLNHASSSSASIYGLYVQGNTSSSQTLTGSLTALGFLVNHGGTALATSLTGVSGAIQVTSNTVSSSFVQSTIALAFQASLTHNGSGVVTNLIGYRSGPASIASGATATNLHYFRVDSPSTLGGSVNQAAAFYGQNIGHSGITSSYGLKLDNQSGSTTNWAINTGTGLNQLGDQLVVVGSQDIKQFIVKANGSQSSSNGLLHLQSSGGSDYTVFNNVGLVSKYNADTTAGNGLASIVGSISLTGQTATIAATNIFTPPVNGMYEASIYLEDTTASTSGGTVLASIIYTDDNGSQTQSTVTLPLNVAGYTSNVFAFFAKTSAAIQYSTTVAGVIVGSPQYALRVILKRLS